MIERLFDEERPYGGPQRGKAAIQINEVRQLLMGRLDSEGQALLEQLSDLYIRQSGLEMKDAFAEGFSVAVKLLVEALER